MKIAGKIPAIHVHSPQMFRYGFDGLCGFLNELKPMFKITPRVAQNEGHFWTGVDQAFEGLWSVASDMIGLAQSREYGDRGLGVSDIFTSKNRK